jgi:hypothetical protein
MTMIRGARSRWLLTVGGVVVAAAAVACQSSPDRAPAGPGGVSPVVQGEPPPSSSPGHAIGNRLPAPAVGGRPTSRPAVPKVGGTGGTRPTRPAPPGPSRCHTADLAVEVGQSDSGMGHTGLNLALVNRSTHPCRIYGYGGMQLLNAAGGPLPTRQVRDGSAPQLVMLLPGGRAYSSLLWVSSPEAPSCSGSAFLLVTPPDETESIRVAFTHTVCENGRIQQGPYQTTPV